MAALALLLPVPVFAAAPAAAPPAAQTKPATPATQPKVNNRPGDARQSEDQLSEVTISAEKPTRKVADLIPFLRRILGEYTVDGKVDLGGQGKPEGNPDTPPAAPGEPAAERGPRKKG